ncbi:MAG: hypothetical protein ABI625_18170 [bacterium]
MRTPTSARLRRVIPVSAAIVVVLAGLPGCATLRATVGAYETGPHGIARPQQRLREALARADYTAALGWHEDDELLRELSLGVSSYYASQFGRSAAVLDSAALLADDRITNSVSGNALALLTNDLARPYQLRRTERLFIPYYGMLAYARLEQWEDAAVEARRLSALLAQYAADRTDAERPTHATLHYLAGVVFERAREHDEAQVAYRLARTLLPQPADSERSHGAQGEGDVLVVVERGFVAHRATQSISVFLGDADRDSLRATDHESNSNRASRIAERIARGEDGPRGPHRRRPDNDDDDDEDGYWLSVSFPSVRRGDPSIGEATLLVDGASVTNARMVSLLDDAVVADEGRERTALLARAIARAAAKYVVTKAVKDNKGDVAGSIANIGASLLERADVRSWHLLPQEITLLRVHAAAGQRQLQLALGGDATRIDIGPVNVRAGMVTIAAVRLWRDPATRVIAAR